jgi:hypothetical protein
LPVYPYAIYALTDPREADDIKRIRYVGKGPPLKRYREHVHAARRGIRRHCYNWFRNVLAAGLFPGQRILEWTTARDGSEREQAWICSLREQGADLTNLTDGGEGTPGLKRSPKECARLSALHRGKKISVEQRAKISATLLGRESPNKGNHFRHSEEAKRKIGTASAGRKHSSAARTKISAALTGRRQSPETIMKRILANTGKKRSLESRLRMSVAQMGNKNNLGHHASKETLARMSARMMGNKFGRDPSPETRAKLSKAGMGNKNALGYRHPDEAKLKMSITRRGRKYPLRKRLSEDARAKISASLMGNKRALGNHFHHSEETKLKMSATQRARWARRKAILTEPSI